MTPASSQEVEIRASVRLLDVAYVHLHVSAIVSRLWRSPLGTPARELVFRNIEMEAPCLDVELDEVPLVHQRERPADGGFGADMKDDGAICGAAHPRVRDPHHVGDAGFQHGRR
jgi:hypothetical protein